MVGVVEWEELEKSKVANVKSSTAEQEFVGLAAIGGCIAQVIHIAWRSPGKV